MEAAGSFVQPGVPETRVPCFVYWGGQFYDWCPDAQTHRLLTDDQLHRRLRWFLTNIEAHRPRKDGEGCRVERLEVRASHVRELADALRLHAAPAVPEGLRPPFYLAAGRPHPDPARTVVFRDRVVTIGRDGWTSAPRHVALFAPAALPFDLATDGQYPQRFMHWIHDRFGPDEAEAERVVDFLQEWMGYLLIGACPIQRAMFLRGGPRTGKSTLADICAALVGEPLTARVPVSTLGGDFGLQPVIGKRLLVLPDMSLNFSGQGKATEKLKALIGGDNPGVPRKNKTNYEGVIEAKVMAVSNQPIDLKDASGALAERFMTLPMEAGFVGEERPEVRDQLMAELPAIARWALDGLVRLLRRGRFDEPPIVKAERTAMREAGGPLRAFADECVTFGPGEVPVADLYRAYRVWAIREGDRPTTRARFSRELGATFPEIRHVRVGPERVRSIRGVSAVSIPDGDGLDDDGSFDF